MLAHARHEDFDFGSTSMMSQKIVSLVSRYGSDAVNTIAAALHRPLLSLIAAKLKCH
jgi:hypothetical protein